MVNRNLSLSLFLTLLFCLPSCLHIHAKSDALKRFTENKGQVIDQNGNTRNDIDFKINADHGLNLFIGNGQLHYQWSKISKEHPDHKELYRMDVKLLGSNPNAVKTTTGQLPFFENYYVAQNPDVIIVRAFEKITYHEVYPNIDWVLYFQNGKMEHDFIIREGGKVSDIKIQYKGCTDINLNNDGSLKAITPLGEITEHAPIAYEALGNKKVASSFSLNGDILSFTTERYQGTLIIDPIVDWGTYFGGTEYDDLRVVKVARDGYIYTVGSTNSTTNIATTGAYQTTFAGGSNSAGSDAILSKFNISGNLIWSTYYGGSGNDLGRNVAFDTSGNIYLAGFTNSTDGIATTGAYQTTKLGSASRTEAFLVKLDTSGQRIWGTYFGGAQNEANTAMSLCADHSNHIYLTGNTNSTSGIATPGAYQSTLAGGSDVFLAQFSTTGALNWSTYYGGAGDELPYSLSCDTSGNVYVSGSTLGSPAGIATAGSFQSTYDAAINGEDAFLAKFNPSGQLLWGTYYGNTGVDRVYSSATDKAGNIYLGGTSSSTTGISTTAVHQSAFAGGSEDAFIAKFNSTGLRQWGTYYGGNGSDGISALKLGADNALYFTGYTTSSNGIANSNAMQPSFGGIQDAFAGRINLSGDTLQWASYLGGIDDDNGFGLDIGANGNVVVCGRTVSATGIATSGAYQSSFGGGDADGFLIKIKDCNVPQIGGLIYGDTTVCSGSDHQYYATSSTADSYNWVVPNGWTGSSLADTIDITFNGYSGILKAVAMNDCYHSDTVSLNITVNALPPVPVITRVGNQITTNQTFAGYQWYLNGNAITGATAQNCTLTATGIYTVAVFNTAGCSITSASFDYTETGINHPLVENGISIYPNPVNDFLHIQLKVSAKAVIYDIAGKVLRSITIPSGLAGIDMQHYVTGLYLIRFSDLNGNMLGSCKVSKQ
ncbi:MAG: SBBP repeat-containing protein [Candidatus Pedobacter colombiensis]|uniref:SBBP repeat-containing protein n=1 Tax=Candidatus Pedobacter colombiensis TaxID=3121371 RepID=A0AAJ6B5W7_9SPHI|nr:SBBP repeat-containing protein [Pedobacter sp.]WEK17926.1 MAG: SBBP repeat-containing protein [Pedobacter sp.]